MTADLEIVSPAQILPALRCLRAAGYEVELCFPKGCEVRHLGGSGRPYGHLAYFDTETCTSDWSIDPKRQRLDAPKAFAQMRWRAPSRQRRRMLPDGPWGWLQGRTRVFLIATRAQPTPHHFPPLMEVDS